MSGIKFYFTFVCKLVENSCSWGSGCTQIFTISGVGGLKLFAISMFLLPYIQSLYNWFPTNKNKFRYDILHTMIQYILEYTFTYINLMMMISSRTELHAFLLFLHISLHNSSMYILLRANQHRQEYLTFT